MVVEPICFYGGGGGGLWRLYTNERESIYCGFCVKVGVSNNNALEMDEDREKEGIVGLSCV